MQENFCEHIFDEKTDGYIQIAKLEDQDIKIYNTQYSGIREIVCEVQGQANTYVSPNTYYIPSRRVNNIRQFRALYIDIDFDEDKYGKQEVIYYVWELAWKEEIPFPTMVVDSGRGLHLYWRIQDAPYAALQTWQELEDYLYYKLKHLGADIKATDAARLLRLPGTINSKNNEECKVVHINNYKEHSMYYLREKYLGYKPKEQQLGFQQVKNLSQKKSGVINYFNSYTLHMSRSQDILKILELRDYKVVGYRNFIIHCYTYWQGIYIRDIEELEALVIELNNSFRQPLKITDIGAVIRSTQKAVEKFITYENDVRAGVRRRVTKGMRDKDGYWYKNETLIERLDITREEQKHLKTIIDEKEKYRRCADEKKSKQKAKRRNEEGLTAREQQKQGLINNIKELKSKGLKQKEVAEKLGKGIATIKRYWNN